MEKKFNRNHVTLFLTSGRGDKIRVPYRSGLNWGQRPGRNENQAYLAVPSDIQKSNFFPEPKIKFKVTCDDGFEMIMVRAQQNGKAIQTSENNAILGKYFRKRLGIESGSLISISHLENYGRMAVEFTKNNREEYFMDFSQKG